MQPDTVLLRPRPNRETVKTRAVLPRTLYSLGSLPTRQQYPVSRSPVSTRHL